MKTICFASGFHQVATHNSLHRNIALLALFLLQTSLAPSVCEAESRRTTSLHANDDIAAEESHNIPRAYLVLQFANDSNAR